MQTASWAGLCSQLWDTPRDGGPPLPEQPVPVPDCSLERESFLLSKLSLPWHNMKPSPLILSHRFDLKTLPVDFVECLMRFLPTENEVKVLRLYERERKPIENLSDEDRFMMQFSKIERLMQKMTIMAFIGNFAESIQMLTPVSGRQPWRCASHGEMTWGCLGVGHHFHMGGKCGSCSLWCKSGLQGTVQPGADMGLPGQVVEILIFLTQ